MAPHGIDDLVNGVVQPTRAIEGRMHDYRRRITAKNWMRRPARLVVSVSDTCRELLPRESCFWNSPGGRPVNRCLR